MYPKPLTIYRTWLERSAIDPEITPDQVAIELRMNPAVYRARWQVGRVEHEHRQTGLPILGDMGTPLHIEGNAIITGDYHEPFVDEALFGLLLELARKYKITQLVIGGDWANSDRFSKYRKVVKPIDFEVELEAMENRLVRMVAPGQFKQVYWFSGNHEDRFFDMILGEVGDKHFRRMIMGDVPEKRLRFSKIAWMTCISGGIPWRIAHPDKYARVPVSKVRRLATMYRTNYIGLHEHHLGMTWDETGEYVAVNCGCMADPDKLNYTTRVDNDIPRMQPGFVMLLNGTAHLFGREPFTDWSRWL